MNFLNFLEKAALLRRAREEAEKEVSAYRAKRQKEYEQKLEDVKKNFKKKKKIIFLAIKR